MFNFLWFLLNLPYRSPSAMYFTQKMWFLSFTGSMIIQFMVPALMAVAGYARPQILLSVINAKEGCCCQSSEFM